MEERYKVERFHWTFDFVKAQGGVEVTSCGLGMSKAPTLITSSEQAMAYCCVHGLHVYDFDKVSAMLKEVQA